MGKLIIVRHGESEWNALGKWTGTTDVHLSPKGVHESELMGECLNDLKLDQVYVSQQIRTSETLEGILKGSSTPDVPVAIAGEINERDYGVYTGKNKWQVQKEIGDDAFQALRRGWNYPIDKGETMRDVYDRVVPFYQLTILPQVLDDKNVMIVAHGNSIRSLVKYLESISDEEISKVEMIFGTALIYEVDDDGRMKSKTVRSIDTTPPPA